ncbi:MAG: hypothetical protein NTU57_02875 [Candidatus Aenigmarchaeota archaeon]|nr:hypothetical protein [Candidatus Aenigmarchaeota archaeon]
MFKTTDMYSVLKTRIRNPICRYRYLDNKLYEPSSFYINLGKGSVGLDGYHPDKKVSRPRRFLPGTVVEEVPDTDTVKRLRAYTGQVEIPLMREFVPMAIKGLGRIGETAACKYGFKGDVELDIRHDAGIIRNSPNKNFYGEVEATTDKLQLVMPMIDTVQTMQEALIGYREGAEQFLTDFVSGMNRKIFV